MPVSFNMVVSTGQTIGKTLYSSTYADSAAYAAACMPAYEFRLAASATTNFLHIDSTPDVTDPEAPIPATY